MNGDEIIDSSRHVGQILKLGHLVNVNQSLLPVTPPPRAHVRNGLNSGFKGVGEEGAALGFVGSLGDRSGSLGHDPSLAEIVGDLSGCG